MSHTRPPKVYVPVELESLDFQGNVYGYYHPDSNEYHLVTWGETLPPANHPYQSVALIGRIGSAVEHQGDTLLCGVKTDKGLEFHAQNILCYKETYNLLQNIFSRNTGILETDWMLDKCAIISGCGSVGSLIALELARSGVGSFVLVDNDTIAYHNLCRHQCGVQDVGKFKTHAVKERILQVNPSAKVMTCNTILESINKEIFDEFCKPGAIMLGCADNREGDVYASTISCIYNIPFVSVGLWERACVGEIFYSIPSENMPCYVCPFGKPTSAMSERTSTNRRIYTTQEDLAKLHFEPGISIDISFVTLIALKLILDLFNRDNQNYTPRVINHLSQFTLICNTNDPRLGGERAEIFAYPLQVTTSLKVDYRSPCPPCKLMS